MEANRYHRASGTGAKENKMCTTHGIYSHADCRDCVKEEILATIKVHGNFGASREKVLNGIIAKTRKYPRKTPALKAAQELKIEVCTELLTA